MFGNNNKEAGSKLQQNNLSMLQREARIEDREKNI